MDLPVQMRTIDNVKHRYAIHLQFGGKFLTSLNKLSALHSKKIYYFHYLKSIT